MKSMKVIFIGAALSSLSAPIVAQERTPVVVGFPPTVDYLPAYVSAENGCFTDNGLDVTMTTIPIATNIPPALVANSLQIGVVTPTTLLAAISNGLNLKAVAGAARMVKGKEGVSVVTRPDFTATIAQDFIGKKVGVAGILSITDLMFRKWLKENGVAEGEVTFVEIPFPRMAEMMSSGNVDAVVAAEPVRSMMVNSGVGQRAPFEYHTQVIDDSLLTMWAAEGNWAAANSGAVAAFKQCIADGIGWIAANREEADVIEQKYTNVLSPLKANTWTAEVKPEDFAIYAGVALEFGLITTDLDLASVVFSE